jgi:hypothetical protein
MCGNLRFKKGTWASGYRPRPWCKVKRGVVFVSGGCIDDFARIREAPRL